MNVEVNFVLGVVIFLRLLYIVADFIVRHEKSSWNKAKRRQFVVRIVSLTHAAISGLLTSYGFVDPYLFDCQYGRLVLLFSMGYFLHDCIDMLVYGEGRQYKEYIIHHTLSVIGVISILYSKRLLGLGVICLLVEVQTTFLHLRTILRIFGLNRKNSGLIVFRHVPTSYLLFYISLIEYRAHLLLRILLSCALAFLTYHNCHLQHRFMKMDGYIASENADDDDEIIDPLDKYSETGKTNAHQN
uniref:TLC domain-containing protein n=1 Tax=Syphacia muris TaxID=451379 RepID=A0A0N5ALN0_9BILA